MQVSIVSIAVNAVTLLCSSLFVGIAAQSGAMVSDAVHSASDVFSITDCDSRCDGCGKDLTAAIPMDTNGWNAWPPLLLAVILCGHR